MDLQRWNKSRLGHRPLTVEAFALHRPECLRSPAAPPLHPRTSPCGPEVRSHRRKAVHICCAFHWTTLIEMLSLWRAPRAHLPGSINLWDCGPAPGSNGEAEWTPCCPYDQGLVIEPLGVFRGSFCVGWRYPADNRPLTPCPKCCSCWLSKHPLTDTVEQATHLLCYRIFFSDLKTCHKHSHLRAFASVFPSAWQLISLLSSACSSSFRTQLRSHFRETFPDHFS